MMVVVVFLQRLSAPFEEIRILIAFSDIDSDGDQDILVQVHVQVKIITKTLYQ
jgi:hypothetical protein